MHGLAEALWLRCAPDLHFELQQCRDEGKDIRGLAERVAAIQSMPDRDPQREILAAQLLDETISLPVAEGFPYQEPSDLVAIQAARPQGPRRVPAMITEPVLLDKIYGAWLGRCAGCLLGKPVEGWRRQRLVDFNRAIGNYPIRAYMSSQQPQEILRRFDLPDTWWDGTPAPWINNVACAPADDDTNYTLVALQVLERFGHEFTELDVAGVWLETLPILQTCSAERVAYRNLASLVLPPASATYRNVYREWIGAQIRADLYGYIDPGGMEAAAAMAWRDARLSHVKNGIYGAMWVAAMLAAAHTGDEMAAIIRLGLSEIPARSRLAAAIGEVLRWPEEGLTWEQALQRVHERWDEGDLYQWCHVIPNATIVAIGLLYGEADLERSIGIAVSGAFDTDCNGATVGSIVGLARGAKALPEKWTAPLADRLRSHVLGFAETRISHLAQRTARLVRRPGGLDGQGTSPA